MLRRLLVAAALVAAASAEPEADPQYITYAPYQPVVSYYPQVASYPQYQQVVPSSYAEPKKDATSDLKPTLYTADPGFFTQIQPGSGNYLPDVFGWDRGSEYFNKWLKVPVQLRANRVRWRTDGQMMRNGFNSASGADPNKFTDKYSNPGSYQGRRKREAEPQQYIVNPYTYTFPQYQPVAAPVQAVQTAPVAKSYTPTVYSANPTLPGIWTQLPKGSGNFLPDAFGWDRGSEYFNKWLNVPVQLRANRVRWRTDGQRMRNGFNSASGADPNKFTDKYSNPGSYQGRRKREAEPQQYIVNPYTYSFPQYQPVAAPVQAVQTAPVAKSYTPTVYSANPMVFTQLPKGSGNFLPDVFGWDRGSEYFNKWLNVPVQLRANRVRWRTDGQMMRNGFNSASGADPNKFTDKYSNPGSYQG